MSFSTPSLPTVNPLTDRPPAVNWEFKNQQKTRYFRATTETRLRSIGQPAPDALLCTNTNCRDDHHRRDLNEFYSNIISAMLASDRASYRFHQGNSRNIPGWNDLVKDLYTYSREMFLLWRQNGSPREGHCITDETGESTFLTCS